MAMSHFAFHQSFYSPIAQLTPCSASISTSEGAWQITRTMVACNSTPFHGLSLRLQFGGNGFCDRPAGIIFRVRCASKSAMRVLQEAASAGSGRSGAKLLVRRSRGLSRVAQMEVLEELVQRGQCELVLPVGP